MVGEYLGLLIGIASLGGAALLARSIARWRRRATPTRGRVLRLVRRGSTFNRRRVPEFEFVTAEGDEVTVVSSSSSGRFFVGDEVPVRYDPTSPRKARIDTFGHLYAGPIILVFVGVSATGVWFAGIDDRARELLIRQDDAAVTSTTPLADGAGGDLPTAVAPRGSTPSSDLALERMDRIHTVGFGEDGGMRAAAMDPEGRWALVAVGSGGTRLVDLETGEPREWSDAGAGDRLYSLAFSPDGETVAIGGTGVVWVVGVPGGEVAARLDLAGPAGSRTEVSDLAVAPSGEVLVAASGRDLFFVDLRSGTSLGPVRTGAVPVIRVAWSPDGRFLASGSGGEVAVWPTERLGELSGESARCRAALDDGRVVDLVVDGEGRLVVALGLEGGGGELRVLGAGDCGELATHRRGATRAVAVGLSPGGDEVVVPDDGRVVAVHLSDGGIVGTVGSGLTAAGVLLTAAGDRLVTLSWTDDRITVWERR